MTSVKIADARRHFGELVTRDVMTGERTVIQRRNTEAAALVSIEDLRLLEKIEDDLDLEIARQRRKEPTEPWEKVKKRLGL